MTTTPNDPRPNRWLARGVALALILLTLLTYFGVWNNGFVDYDDNSYVFQNSHITRGIDWQAVKWAITTGHAGNWHPLTWLSHMLDAQLFGLRPGWHHLTNLLIHTANTVLLFLLLKRATSTVWRSALVAALFAVHPLHVESVAWIAERKDVLSAFFFLLTVICYVEYVKRREETIESDHAVSPEGIDSMAVRCTLPRSNAPRFYALSLFFFACGLMSKPMLVTTPFVLLLLDYWPLQRLEIKNQQSRIKNLLLEKVPFFALSIVSCAVTLVVQNEAMMNPGDLPFSHRLGNAMVTCIEYLRQIYWPVSLAAFYPYPPDLSTVRILAAGTAIVAATTAGLVLARSWPFLLVGWCWFLGMLVPVIGLVQVGLQARADRYTYLPSIGIFISIAWGLGALALHWPRWRLAAAGFATAGIAALAVTAHRQVAVWEDTRALFTHAMRVTRDNYVALSSVANLDLQQGLIEAALTNAEHVLQIAPRYPKAEYLVGSVLQMQGKMQEAVPYLEASVGAEVGLPGKARLVLSYLDAGRLAEADATLDEVLRASPGPNALLMKAALLKEQGRIGEAKQLFHELEDHHAKYILDNPTSNYGLAELYSLLGQSRQAAPLYATAIEMRPQFTNALNNFAWLLATDPDDRVRNGARAVELAEQACQLTEWKQPVFMGTLAAAYAEAGRFDDAVQMAGRARDLAKAANQETVAARNAELLELYRQRRPYREAN